MSDNNKVNFTTGRVSAFRCEAGKAASFLWDEDTKGLGLKASPGGSKRYVLESRLESGSTVRLTIGDPKSRTIEDVRKEARRLQTLIDKGIDPRQEKRDRLAAADAKRAQADAARQEAENRQRYTLRTLCEAYGDLLEARGKPSARQARSIFKVHVLEAHPEIAAMPAREVSKLQIAAMVRRTRESGKERAAGVLRSYLSAAFAAAKKSPLDASLPADFIPFEIEHNPVDAIPAIAVRAGSRKLCADELRAYLAALGDDLPDQALLLALLAGGQRMAQLLRARVSDYDEDTASLRLWDTKGRRKAPREHLLPLAPKAAELAARLVARAKLLETTFLFSTHGAVPLDETTPGKRVAAICNAMGGERFDLRDIRRTCETILASMGISRDTRAQLLSHGLSGVQNAHYDMHSYTSEKRAALVAWEERLHEIEVGQRAARNVVSLHAA